MRRTACARPRVPATYSRSWFHHSVRPTANPMYPETAAAGGSQWTTRASSAPRPRTMQVTCSRPPAQAWANSRSTPLPVAIFERLVEEALRVGDALGVAWPWVAVDPEEVPLEGVPMVEREHVQRLLTAKLHNAAPPPAMPGRAPLPPRAARRC